MKMAYDFKLRRIFSSVLVVLFLSQQLTFAAPGLAFFPLSANQKPKLGFELPESIAVIDDMHVAENSQALIFLMQDAHTNASAQINMAKAIDLILKAENISTVFTEAGQGDNSLSHVKKLVDAASRKRGAMSLLKKGLLHGTEYLSLTGERDFTLWGVENRALYDRGLVLYEMVSKQRSASLHYIQKMIRTANALKPQLYTDEMKAYDAISSDYHAGRVSVVDYFLQLEDIAKAQSISLHDFSEIKKIAKLQALESKLNLEAASEEQKVFMNQLPAEDKALLEDAMGRSLSKIIDLQGREERAFHAFLFERMHVPQKTYTNLWQYLNYRKEAQKLNAKLLLGELTLLENKIANALAHTDDAKNLYLFNQHAELLKKFFNLQSTPEEYQRYETKKWQFSTKVIAGFLNRKIMQLRKHYDQALLLNESVDVDMQSINQFYQLTQARDRAFINNMTDAMKSAKEQKAILVSGGYHTKNLKDLLQKAHMSYVSISPQVLHETDHKRYERILLNQLRTHKSHDGNDLVAVSLREKAQHHLPLTFRSPTSLDSQAPLSQQYFANTFNITETALLIAPAEGASPSVRMAIQNTDPSSGENDSEKVTNTRTVKRSWSRWWALRGVHNNLKKLTAAIKKIDRAGEESVETYKEAATIARDEAASISQWLTHANDGVLKDNFMVEALLQISSQLTILRNHVDAPTEGAEQAKKAILILNKLKDRLLDLRPNQTESIVMKQAHKVSEPIQEAILKSLSVTADAPLILEEAKLHIQWVEKINLLSNEQEQKLKTDVARLETNLGRKRLEHTEAALLMHDIDVALMNSLTYEHLPLFLAEMQARIQRLIAMKRIDNQGALLLMGNITQLIELIEWVRWHDDSMLKAMKDVMRAQSARMVKMTQRPDEFEISLEVQGLNYGVKFTKDEHSSDAKVLVFSLEVNEKGMRGTREASDSVTLVVNLKTGKIDFDGPLSRSDYGTQTTTDPSIHTALQKKIRDIENILKDSETRMADAEPENKAAAVIHDWAEQQEAQGEPRMAQGRASELFDASIKQLNAVLQSPKLPPSETDEENIVNQLARHLTASAEFYLKQDDGSHHLDQLEVRNRFLKDLLSSIPPVYNNVHNLQSMLTTVANPKRSGLVGQVDSMIRILKLPIDQVPDFEIVTASDVETLEPDAVRAMIALGDSKYIQRYDALLDKVQGAFADIVTLYSKRDDPENKAALSDEELRRTYSAFWTISKLYNKVIDVRVRNSLHLTRLKVLAKLRTQKPRRAVAVLENLLWLEHFVFNYWELAEELENYSRVYQQESAKTILNALRDAGKSIHAWAEIEFNEGAHMADAIPSPADLSEFLTLPSEQELLRNFTIQVREVGSYPIFENRSFSYMAAIGESGGARIASVAGKEILRIHTNAARNELSQLKANDPSANANTSTALSIANLIDGKRRKADQRIQAAKKEHLGQFPFAFLMPLSKMIQTKGMTDLEIEALDVLLLESMKAAARSSWGANGQAIFIIPLDALNTLSPARMAFWTKAIENNLFLSASTLDEKQKNYVLVQYLVDGQGSIEGDLHMNIPVLKRGSIPTFFWDSIALAEETFFSLVEPNETRIDVAKRMVSEAKQGLGRILNRLNAAHSIPFDSESAALKGVLQGIYLIGQTFRVEIVGLNQILQSVRMAITATRMAA